MNNLEINFEHWCQICGRFIEIPKKHNKSEGFYCDICDKILKGYKDESNKA